MVKYLLEIINETINSYQSALENIQKLGTTRIEDKFEKTNAGVKKKVLGTYWDYLRGGEGIRIDSLNPEKDVARINESYKKSHAKLEEKIRSAKSELESQAGSQTIKTNDEYVFKKIVSQYLEANKPSFSETITIEDLREKNGVMVFTLKTPREETMLQLEHTMLGKDAERSPYTLINKFFKNTDWNYPAKKMESGDLVPEARQSGQDKYIVDIFKD